MTTAEHIEETLKKEGFKVKIDKRKKKKVEIRREGFDEEIENKDREVNRDIVLLITEYLKDISHNLTLNNIKRTIKLFKDIIKWVLKKNE